MIRPSKEFTILAAGLLVGAAGLWSIARVGGLEELGRPPKVAARPYAPPKRAFAPFAQPAFEAYWPPGKRDITTLKQELRDAPLEEIPLPFPPAPAWVAPRLRPWPGTGVRSGLPAPPSAPRRPGSSATSDPARPAGARPPPRTLPLFGPPSAAPGARPAPEHLLPAAELAGILKLPPPADDDLPDRRSEKVREFDLVQLRATNTAFEGAILDENATSIIFRHKLGVTQTLQRQDIVQIEHAWTFAQKYAVDAKALAENDARGREKLGVWCLERGMVPEGLAEFEKASAAAPADGPIALKLASLYRRLGSFNAELKTLDRAARQGASARDQAWLALGDFYRVFGLHPEAAAAYENAARLMPSQPDVLGRIAEEELAQGRLDQALASADRALGADRGAVRALIVRAQVLLARGDVAAARALAQTVAGNSPDAPPPVGASDASPALNLLGVAHFVEGNFAEAVKAFARSAKANPAQVQALVNLGIVYVLAGKADDAEALFALAASRDPADAIPLDGLGLAGILKAKSAPPPTPAPDAAPEEGAKPEEGRPAPPPGPSPPAVRFEKAFAVDPRDPYAGYALGMAALQAGDLTKAEEAFRAALRADADFTPALDGLGATLLAAARGEDAEACFWRLAERGEASADERIALAAARCARQDFAKAVEDLQALQTLAPRDPAVWNLLAYVDYVHLRNPAAAIAKLETSLSCVPGEPYAAAIVERVREVASKVLWEETFDRADADEIGNLWVEFENHGIDVKIAGKRCVFSGAQSVENWADTAIEREGLSENFLQFEAEFDFKNVSRATVGLRLVYAMPSANVSQGVYLVRDELGRFGYSAHNSTVAVPKWREAKPAPPPVPAPGAKDGGAEGPAGQRLARLAIVRPPPGERSQEFQLFVNGVKVGAIETGLRDHMPRYKLAVFTRAAVGTKVDFELDNVRVYERKAEERK